jgi:hypothetical protein
MVEVGSRSYPDTAMATKNKSADWTDRLNDFRDRRAIGNYGYYSPTSSRLPPASKPTDNKSNTTFRHRRASESSRKHAYRR